MSVKSARARAATARSIRPLLLATLAAGVLATAWIVATMATGVTYHLHPALIAAAPAVTVRLAARRRATPSEIGIATVIGLAIVALGWIVLLATDEAPTATFVDPQPGGVGGEVVVFSLAGAFAAGWWSSRAPASEVASQERSQRRPRS